MAGKGATSGRPLRAGIAGLGTVGAGVVRLLQEHGSLIARRAGRPVEIAAVSARDRKRDRGVNISSYAWRDDPLALASSDDVDVVVELIGGAEGPARALAEAALANGKALVTANKALMAHHGSGLAALAEKNGVALMFEAAVAGGIPVIKTLREGLAANEIRGVAGILNGTCNYILTEMRETGRDFSDVLKEAQEKGYAEADPATDIEGTDAAHKLCLLGALAYGIRPDMGRVQVTGIGGVTAQDIFYARELGYRIKLLGIARRQADGGIVQTVEPCLVPAGGMMGAVDGVYNAVLLEADFAGSNLSVGRGAGAGPTASAVTADLIDCARGVSVPAFGVPAHSLAAASWADPGAVSGRFYIHLAVNDRAGVLAEISAVMRDFNVSVESLLQRGRDPGNPVSIVLTTHTVKRADIESACRRMESLESVRGKPCLIRIEAF